MPQLAGPVRPSRAARFRRLRAPRRRFYALLGAATLVFGGIMLYAGALGTWLDARVRTWPTTAGRLLSVEISNDTIGVLVNRRSNTMMRQLRFHVRYAYTVAGVSRVGNQIGARANEARVGGRRHRYGVGQSVTVHYNPTDPGEAVIETPFPFGAVIGIGFGVLLLGSSWRIYRLHLRKL